MTERIVTFRDFEGRDHGARVLADHGDDVLDIELQVDPPKALRRIARSDAALPFTWRPV